MPTSPSSSESENTTAPHTATDAERLGWLAMTLTPGLGPTRIHRAVERLGSAERALSSSLTELEATGMPASSAQFLFDGRARTAAEEEWKRVQQADGKLLTPGDSDYPDRLREIYDPPTVLWLRGSASLLSRPGIAVVGTRSPSTYGAAMAESLSRDLAAHRLTIISGMARGVDTHAHHGAMQTPGGRTIAVWGTGIDVIYPKENKKLAEHIIATGGSIISEYPLGTFPAPQNFPIRNRILSGMSIGVLVVEAGEYSGTRITARMALEQNRDVYAVPGNVTNKGAWGPNMLIRQGARLTATWEDVWEDLPTEVRLQLEEELVELAQAKGDESQTAPGASHSQPTDLPEMQRLVLGQLRVDQSIQIDELIEQMEQLQPPLSSTEIFAALLELELAGHVKQLPGKNYVRAM
jgi:DNA processing protein